LPQATKLSQIYTGVLDQYNQGETEQEVFNSLASAQRKRRALTEREIASFSGTSGLSKTALDRQTGGQY
jgi:isocitrate dehydrogenase kinase/phosphatase